MKVSFRVVGMVASLIFLSGCWQKNDQDQDKVVLDDSKPRVINVLDEQYFKDAHIPGSLNISLDELENVTKDWKKDVPIVIYCANYKCSASDAAARKLMGAGFTNVKAYEAGMAGWAQAGLPVEGVAQESYLTQPNDKLEEHAEASDDETKSPTDVIEISTPELATLLGIGTTQVVSEE